MQVLCPGSPDFCLFICFALVADVELAFIGKTKGCDSACQQECIGVHNIYRANHGAPLLVYDQSLADKAQELIDRGQLKHSDWIRNSQGGETFAWGSLFPTFTAAIKRWYDGGFSFNYNTFKANWRPLSIVRHFAQVIWRSTRKIGCGRGKLDGQPWYVVLYDRGAVMKSNEMRNNIKPPKKNDKAWFQKSSPFAKELKVATNI